MSRCRMAATIAAWLGVAACAVAHPSMGDGAGGDDTYLGVPVSGIRAAADAVAGSAKPARAAAAPAPAAAVAQLSYRPDTGVHERVVARLTGFFTQGDAARRPLIAHRLDQADPLGQFDALLRQQGYDSRNLADVFTAYLVLSWEVVNAADAMQAADGVQAVRDAVRQAFAANARMRALPDADKQTVAETLGYLAMVAVAAQRELAQAGNPVALAELREGVRKTARNLAGVDLGGVLLDDSGFTPR